jgi:hypothetical protein
MILPLLHSLLFEDDGTYKAGDFTSYKEIATLINSGKHVAPNASGFAKFILWKSYLNEQAVGSCLLILISYMARGKIAMR